VLGFKRSDAGAALAMAFRIETGKVGDWNGRSGDSEENALFSGKFNAYALHNFAVSPSGSFGLLAKSGKCAHAIKHKERDLYGVLFHPEVRNVQIIDNFVKNRLNHAQVSGK
jgi:GMP synthase-like glutamine amidotransferase